MPSPISDENARALREIERLAGATASGGAPAPPPRTGLAGYAEATKTATYGYLAALPLLVAYEIGVIAANTGDGQIRVGADVWLKSLLTALGVTGGLVLAAVVVIIGGVVLWMEREKLPPLRASYFGGILLESLVYAIVLAFLVSALVVALFAVALSPAAPLALAQMRELSLPLQLALSIGAGLYEELVFRVILVGGLFFVLKMALTDRRIAYVVAAVIGAFVFSWVHHLGPLADPFELSVFTYRFVFGLALNAVFLVRGFAMAAWTHALYDILVVTSLL